MKIVLAGPYPAGTAENFRNLLPEHEISEILTQDEYDMMTDANCIIVRILKTPEKIIANNPGLKAIIRWGAGYDSVDIQTAGCHGVLVANTPGTNAYAVAELAVGMMIVLNRKLPGYSQNVRQGNWDRGAYASTSLSLNHKTVGLIGGGNIGRKVAALVKGFGADVIYYDAYRLSEEQEQQAGMTYVPFEQLLEDSDIISLHVPLSDSTYHIIGASELRKMKSTACLINTARGGLIDDEALLQELESSMLAGAGLDCVENETSIITERLLNTPNVMVTPHIGGSTADLAEAMIPEIAGKIKDLAERGDMNNVVNRQFLNKK